MSPMVKFGTVFLLWLFSCVLVLANDYVDQDEAQKFLIERIQIHGLSKTKEDIVFRQLEIQDGEALTRAQIEAALQRLRNTELFWAVKFELVALNSGQFNLIIMVTEKWTLNPIYKVGGAGGTHYQVIGLFDRNVFGQFFEIGAQQENLGGHLSHVFWIKKPQAFHRRMLLSAEDWNIMRNRVLWDHNRRVTGGFTLHRIRRRLSLRDEFSEKRFFTLQLATEKDQINEEMLTNWERGQNALYQSSFPFDEEFTLAMAKFQIGRAEVDDERREGQSLELGIERGFARNQTGHSFLRTTAEYLEYWKLPMRTQFASRLFYGHIDRNLASQNFYLGGFDSLRAFEDSQFQTQDVFYGNVEFRWPIKTGSNLMIQQALFYDFGWLEFSKSDQFVDCIGTGFRFIFPKIARLVIRLDGAYAWGYSRGSGVSFGLQHFY